MKIFNKFFLLPTIITLIAVSLIYYHFGLTAFLATCILVVLEVTLSFDNAVVNAKVLEKMDEVWRHRFITWGIWLAVFGTRVVLPIVIVAIASGINILEVLKLAMYSPELYGQKLHEAHYTIGSFGGIFLLLVALKYFIDDAKEVHWLHKIEVQLKKFSSIESFEIIFSLFVLLIISSLIPEHAVEILVAGIVGIILFVLMQGTTKILEKNFESKNVKKAGIFASAGFGLFMYLNILDTAFSLDGVIGAFAISTNILIIATGLGIGAYFVRSFTLMMVEEKTLKELVYLEHGAHWAVGGLALCMLVNLIFHIPEIVTGLIGLLFVATAYISSKKA